MTSLTELINATVPPIHTIVISFATCAVLLLFAGRHFPKLFTNHEIGDNYSILDFKNRIVDIESQKSASIVRVQRVKNRMGWESLGVVIVAVLILTSRVELYRRLNNSPQCANLNLEVSLLGSVIATLSTNHKGLPSFCNRFEPCRYIFGGKTEERATVERSHLRPRPLSTLSFRLVFGLLAFARAPGCNKVHVHMPACWEAIFDPFMASMGGSWSRCHVGNGSPRFEPDRDPSLPTKSITWLKNMGIDSGHDGDHMVHYRYYYTYRNSR